MCPHCGESIPVRIWSVGVFKCNKCHKEVRVESDEIAQIIRIYDKKEGAAKTSERILSLVDRYYMNEKPSGIVVVKKCDNPLATWSHDTCDFCHGEEQIESELSVGEVLEWAKESIRRAKDPRNYDGDKIMLKDRG